MPMTMTAILTTSKLIIVRATSVSRFCRCCLLKIPVTNGHQAALSTLPQLQRWSDETIERGRSEISDFDIENVTVVRFSEIQATTKPGNNKSSVKDDSKPASDALEKVYKGLTEGHGSLPQFFAVPHNWHLYSHNVIFEDHIRGIRTQGIREYIINLSMLKIKAHLMFSHVKLHVLKATKHEDENCIKVRWQIVGVPGLRIFFTFFRYSFLNWKKIIENVTSDVYDGFSTFYVNSEGKIYKHVCDKMMSDDERVAAPKNPIAKSLGIATG